MKRKLYFKIIRKALSETRVKGDGEYYEAHHILPSSIYPKFKKCQWNKVLLTAREHLICHRLLCDIFKYNAQKRIKMEFALWSMCQHRKGHKRILNSRIYEYAKIRHAHNTSEMFLGKKRSKESIEKMLESRVYDGLPGELNGMYGKSHSEDSIKKMSKSSIGKMHSTKTKEKMSKSHAGRKNSEETKEKMSSAAKKRHQEHPLSAESIKSMKEKLTGRSVSDEVKNKISKTMKGKKRQIITCPHCGKSGANNLMKRYHFDNCKLRGKVDGQDPDRDFLNRKKP
jgi:hypothetical protein